MLKSWNHEFFRRKPSKSWWSVMTSFWHRNSEPMSSKIASWTTPVGTSATIWVPSSLSLLYKNKHFQPHGGQWAVRMCSKALQCDFIAHIVLKSWNHWCPSGKTTNSWWSWPRLAQKIWAHVVQNHNQHYFNQNHNYTRYVYSDLPHSMLWVAGGNGILNIHYNRYRGERCDLTLPYLTLPYLKLV